MVDTFLQPAEDILLLYVVSWVVLEIWDLESFIAAITWAPLVAAVVVHSFVISLPGCKRVTLS